MRSFEFAKTNSGALIIGVSLIIGLNFERFTNYAADAIYHLSGKADADQAKAQQEAIQLENERQAGIAKEQAHYARLHVEAAAWQDFLTAARTKFPQIAVVKNSSGGDYACLRIAGAEVANYQARDSISDDFVLWLNSNGLLDRHDWKYHDIKDFYDLSYVGCWQAKNIWRANRYQNRLD
jgi:hypothetical protein